MEELTLPWDDEDPREETLEKVLTVSEVNRLAKQALQQITVSVRGEVSGLNTRYPYYVYLDLRDEEAALPAILTRRLFEELDFLLEEGISVVARGTLSLYERQGRYQIRIAEVRPFGEGEIQLRIEALKKKLHAEGLFAEERKKSLPRFPQRIGVVTSTRGAAIRDVTVTLSGRFPPLEIFVRGVKVQGEGAVQQICEALELFDSAWPVDLVILARGGGSIQDLEAFSTEPVARTLSRIGVPVVTGIGHEPDVSVADLVADRRGSTPTAAAQVSVPEKLEVKAFLFKTESILRRNAHDELLAGSKSLKAIQRLPLYRTTDFLLGPFMQRFERSEAALPESPGRGLLKSRGRLAVVASRPVFRKPEMLAARAQSRLEERAFRLCLAAARVVEKEYNYLEKIVARAKALSPLAVLERGYSITFNKETGAVLRAPDDVELGSQLRVRLAKGSLDAEVTGKE